MKPIILILINLGLFMVKIALLVVICTMVTDKKIIKSPLQDTKI